MVALEDVIKHITTRRPGGALIRGSRSLTESARVYPDELSNLIDVRMVRHRDYYEKNEMLQSNYIFVKKVVDFLVSLR